MNINDIVKNIKEEKDGIYYAPGAGYWSNLDKSKNRDYLKDLNALGSEKTVRKYFPEHEDAIFPLKRAGGMATLDICESDTILDAGCMWGALSVPLARTKANIIAVDQTEESLRLLKQRKLEEGLENIHLVRANLKEINFHNSVFTKVIVNGVLEWLPEHEEVEVNKFIKSNKQLHKNVKKIFSKSKKERPIDEQRCFLKKLHASLSDRGCLYLAIENRYNIFYFLGMQEEHCGIRFISLLPRFAQDTLSILLKGRRFRTWTHSKKALKELLYSAGFSRVEIFYAFPDYKEPDFILSEKRGMDFFRYYKSIGEKPVYKKVILRLIEEIIYRRLRCTFFAPSFIVHAYKK